MQKHKGQRPRKISALSWQDQRLKNMVVKYLLVVQTLTDLKGNVSGIVMMIEFESKEAANTFYHSEESTKPQKPSEKSVLTLIS